MIGHRVTALSRMHLSTIAELFSDMGNPMRDHHVISPYRNTSELFIEIIKKIVNLSIFDC